MMNLIRDESNSADDSNDSSMESEENYSRISRSSISLKIAAKNLVKNKALNSRKLEFSFPKEDIRSTPNSLFYNFLEKKNNPKKNNQLSKTTALEKSFQNDFFLNPSEKSRFSENSFENIFSEQQSENIFSEHQPENLQKSTSNHKNRTKIQKILNKRKENQTKYNFMQHFSEFDFI